MARQDMTPIVVGAFRSHLSASLAVRGRARDEHVRPNGNPFGSLPPQMTARALPQLEEDGRLLPMLNSLRFFTARARWPCFHGSWRPDPCPLLDFLHP